LFLFLREPWADLLFICSMIRVCAALVCLGSAALLRDDSAKSLAAMESIMESARNGITAPAPSHDGEMAAFLNEMKSVAPPALGHRAAGCDAEHVFTQTWNSFNSAFPHAEYGQFVQRLDADLERYSSSSAYTGYATVKGQARCHVAQMSNETKGLLASDLKGMDVAGKAIAHFMNANGPAAAQAPGIGLLAKTAVKQVKGVLQTVVATVLTDVPPMIPPPAWNNMPFPCMPMVTGHNCAGAVNYPITIGDFVLADMTDSALDGTVAGFPAYYRKHIGATDDATYQRCFSSYMGMQCANAFPMCTTVQARQNDVPFLGRGPMCFLHCVQTLIACPGMWVDDLEEVCQHVSVPPVCSFATYQKSAPAQLQTYDEAHGSALSCPSAGEGAGASANAPRLA